MNYTTIYDVSHEGMAHYWLIPLSFVIAGVLMWIFTKRNYPPQNFGESRKSTGNFTQKMAPVFYPLFIGLSALVFITLLISGRANYNKTQAILSSKTFDLVEGKVENYKRWAPRGVQVKESFSIDTLKFNFDESDATYVGYRPRHTQQIIDKGMYLRISYYQEGSKKIVLKIEKGS